MPLKARAFLTYFAKTGRLLDSLKAAEWSTTMHYRGLKESPAYAHAFEEAHQRHVERLEAEATRRAVEGVQEPVYQNSQLAGFKTRYSDALLMFLLRGAARQKYSEHVTSEVTSKNVNINANQNLNIDLTKLTADELRSLDGLLAKLAPPVADVADAGAGREGAAQP